MRYIAFLRGINVGGHRVKMDRLRALFEELGFSDVSTFIASGNVLFETGTHDAASLTPRIEAHLEAELGYAVATFLRTPAELTDIVSFTGRPFDTADASHYVLLLDAPAPDGVRHALGALESDTDRFTFEGSEIHWQLSGKLSASPLFGPGVDKATKGIRTTSRNMTTLRKIAAKVG